jgi:DNA-binding LacI/PurR family transcriptional regulator
LPVVLLDRGDPSLHLDTVRVDNEGAAFEAVSYLTGLGHRRVAIISGLTTGVPTRAGRLNGYLRALEAAGIEACGEYQRITATSAANGRAAALELLSLADPPTALFVTNTFLAVGALGAVHERGLRIPEQVSFLMFDDPDWSVLLDPPVTAIAQPTHEIGARAFTLLERRLGADSERPPEEAVLATSRIERASCGPPPSAPGGQFGD